jgi:nitrite reductase/ring-hydroxylating ferredoxin subunit
MNGRTGPEATRYLFVELAKGLDEIWCGTRRAFLLVPPGEKPAIVAGRCPHRGGPLALGVFDCRDRRWRCPWHGQKHALPTLYAGAWPAIRRGDVWLVAVEAERPDDTPVCLTRPDPRPGAASPPTE